MNTNISKYILMAGVAALSLSSCTGDLDTKPFDPSTLTPNQVYANDSSYESLTAKIYSAFSLPGSDAPSSGDIVGADQGEATFTRSYWNLEELPTDEAKIAWSDEGLNGLQYDQWAATNRFVMLLYDRLELINAYCNEMLIQSTDDKLSSNGISAGSDKYNKVQENRAEVRTLRALSYYVLADIYGNVPFVDENTGIGAYKPEQRGRDYLFPWIESELKDVIDKVPAKTTLNYGKVNRYVVDMLLANLYMNAEAWGQGNHYADAVPYLNDIIDNGGYSLEPTYKFNFEADNDQSPEMIFPLIQDGIHAQCYGGTTYLTAGAYGDDMSAGDNFGLPQYWSGIRAPEDLSNLFTNDDSRAMFWTDNRTKAITNMADFKQGYSVVKYTNLKKDGSTGSDKTFPDTDFPFYRLADTYLLYVECALRGAAGTDQAKAVRLYNQIEQRAYGNNSHNIASLNNLTMDELLDERSRELYWEGHRRTDLIRFNRFVSGKNWTWKGGSYAGSATIDSKYLLYPVPSTDLSANHNLKQNEGY